MKNVAPLTGAWIEIGLKKNLSPTKEVAPLTGAWIEMTERYHRKKRLRSLPSRERGLKFLECLGNIQNMNVAPLTGAWIEIMQNYKKYAIPPSLPSRERGLKYTRCSV